MNCTKGKGREYDQEYYAVFDYFIGYFWEAGMHELLVIGYLSVVSSHLLFVICQWSLVSGHLSLVTCHLSLVISQWSSVIGHWLLVTGH